MDSQPPQRKLSALQPAAGKPPIPRLLLTPLAESVISGFTPDKRSELVLGSVSAHNPEFGAWRIAALENRRLTDTLYRVTSPIEVNRCSLHSQDHVVQLAVSIPPLSGTVLFETTWYPPHVPDANAYNFALVITGKGGTGKRVAAEENKEYDRNGDAPMHFRPVISIHALSSIGAFEIYATPYAISRPEPGPAAVTRTN